MPTKRPAKPAARERLELLAVKVQPEVMRAIEAVVAREQEARPGELVALPDVVRRELYRVFVTEAPRGGKRNG